MSSAGSSRLPLSSLSTYQSTSQSRLKSLYSDFSRHKQSNPSSYASNVEWWKRTLEVIVLKGWQSSSIAETVSVDRLILHANNPTLAEVFRLEGVGKPLGLAAVVTELRDSKAYFPLSQFMTATCSVYDPAWLPYRIASYVVGKPLWWALQQLSIVEPGGAGGHGGDAERWHRARGDYVVLSLLERAADNVLQKQQAKIGASLADSLYNFDTFKKEFADGALEGVTLSDMDMKVLLKYLERDRKAVVVQQEVIKFVHSSEAPEISAVDIGVLELNIAVANLESATERIQQQIDERSEKIAVALSQKRKEVALSHLRARKQLDDLLKKRLSSLDILHSTLIRVEASAGDVKIMNSYESSTATLRAILAHPSLRREKINETMDAMASAHADAREIDDAIRLGTEVAQTEAGIDDAELEDELNKLIKETEKAELAKKEAEQKTREKLESEQLAAPLNIPVSHPPVQSDVAVKEAT